MIESIDELADHALLEAEVVIVGSGAAGIPMALELAEAGWQVLLLEAGHSEEHAPTQNLYAGTVANAAMHSPPDTYRQRRLGGSTVIWGGRCMPFDPLDFEVRDHIPHSGWPIKYEDLAPHYPKANQYLEAGEFAYTDASAFPIDTPPLIDGFTSKRVRTDGLERFSCPTNLYARYGHRLRQSPNIRVIEGANCTGLRLNAEGAHLDHLEVSSLGGKRIKVQGQQVVLAVGGLETARLLLASKDVHPQGVGNQHDVVGRYYQCHIAGNVGALTFEQPLSRVRHGYEVSPDGIYCRRRISLTPEAQQALKVPNIVLRLHFPKLTDPSHRIGVLSGLFLARPFISYEYGKRLKDGPSPTLLVYLQHLRNIVFDSVDTLGFLIHWIRKRTLAERKFPSVILRNRSHRFSFEVHGEQVPNPDSRVSLGTELDALGLPRIHIDWRYCPEDVEGVRRTLKAVGEELAASGVGRLEIDDARLEEELMRFGAYGGHHVGTTRMGNDPRTSVVNANARLHGVDNLYIASSAVFPTSSQANPTLTITAMALRLVQHLIDQKAKATPQALNTAQKVEP